MTWGIAQVSLRYPFCGGGVSHVHFECSPRGKRSDKGEGVIPPNWPCRETKNSQRAGGYCWESVAVSRNTGPLSSCLRESGAEGEGVSHLFEKVPRSLTRCHDIVCCNDNIALSCNSLIAENLHFTRTYPCHRAGLVHNGKRAGRQKWGKMGKRWKICPDWTRGENSRKILKKWKIGLFFGHFSPIFNRGELSTFFPFFPFLAFGTCSIVHRAHMVWPLPRPWSETMVSIPLSAL